MARGGRDKSLRDKAGRFRLKRGMAPKSREFHGGGYGVTPETENARRSHRRVSLAEKARLGIPQNIWDAARKYRTHTGTPRRSLRDVIRDPDFRDAWNVWRDRSNPWDARAKAAQKWGWFEKRDNKWRYIG